MAVGDLETTTYQSFHHSGRHHHSGRRHHSCRHRHTDPHRNPHHQLDRS